jgi:hypothetical protein
VLDHIYVPESVEHYGDITSYYLMKIHKVFPDSSILVFEASEGQWKLINYLKNFKTEPKLMTGYKVELFDRCASEGELVRLDQAGLENSPAAAELFRVFGIKFAIAAPFMRTGGQARRLILYGESRRDRFDAAFDQSAPGAEQGGEKAHPVEPYLCFVASQLNAIYKTSEKILSARKENEQLRGELNAVLRELDMAGSRLIRGAKERKALYEVVTKVSGEEKDVNQGAAAILNVVAKMVDADVAACLLFDEAKQELVVSPERSGVPGSVRQALEYPVADDRAHLPSQPCDRGAARGVAPAEFLHAGPVGVPGHNSRRACDHHRNDHAVREPVGDRQGAGPAEQAEGRVPFDRQP